MFRRLGLRTCAPARRVGTSSLTAAACSNSGAPPPASGPSRPGSSFPSINSVSLVGVAHDIQSGFVFEESVLQFTVTTTALQTSGTPGECAVEKDHHVVRCFGELFAQEVQQKIKEGNVVCVSGRLRLNPQLEPSVNKYYYFPYIQVQPPHGQVAVVYSDRANPPQTAETPTGTADTPAPPTEGLPSPVTDTNKLLQLVCLIPLREWTLSCPTPVHVALPFNTSVRTVPAYCFSHLLGSLIETTNHTDVMRPASARRKLTEAMILQKTHAPTLADVRNLNYYGEHVEDISVLSQLRNAEAIALVSNRVTQLGPLAACAQLRELYLRKNRIESLVELNALRGLHHLHTLWLMDNPCAQQPHYRAFAIFCCPHLEQLDDTPVTPGERAAAMEQMTPHFVQALLAKQPGATKSPRSTSPPTPSPRPSVSPSTPVGATPGLPPKPTPSPRPSSPSAIPRTAQSAERRSGRDTGGKEKEKEKVSPTGRPTSPEARRVPSGHGHGIGPTPPLAPKPQLPAPTVAPPPAVARTKAPQGSARAGAQEPVLTAVRALLPLLSVESMEELQRELADRMARERRRRTAQEPELRHPFEQNNKQTNKFQTPMSRRCYLGL
eukprot:gene4959-3557_t